MTQEKCEGQYKKGFSVFCRQERGAEFHKKITTNFREGIDQKKKRNEEEKRERNSVEKMRAKQQKKNLKKGKSNFRRILKKEKEKKEVIKAWRRYIF